MVALQPNPVVAVADLVEFGPANVNARRLHGAQGRRRKELLAAAAPIGEVKAEIAGHVRDRSVDASRRSGANRPSAARCLAKTPGAGSAIT